MKHIYIFSALIGTALLLSSCDDFLNTMPDNRAEIDTEAKVTSILVSAYPNKTPVLMMEYSSDNVVDHGPQYAVNYKIRKKSICGQILRVMAMTIHVTCGKHIIKLLQQLIRPYRQ